MVALETHDARLFSDLAAQLAVVAAANVTVAEFRFERGRDLEVGAHFEDAVGGTARRSDGQRFD